ncbi:MAG TPA: tol-pal system protein YbgF [Candidatus Acidoferrales bacterium]|nr:tol-pal system protein YbgF [Candidatus Acidoferrales bacterium]
MRARTVVLSLAFILAGAIGGAMLAPPSANAVSREIIEIQQTVNQILQNQQDIRSDVDAKFASMQTLIQQSNDATTHLSLAVGAMQKSFQDAQANSGASNSTVAQQMTGLSDNMQDLQARVGKLAQQMTDIQSTLQTINAKVSAPPPTQAAPTSPDTGGDAPANTQPGATVQPTGAGRQVSILQPISGDTLYSGAVRDLNGRHYDLSRQEFTDYLKNFPDGPFAANSQFYLGELNYAQGDYNAAISAYDKVIVNYRRSSKVAPSMLEKGRALAQLGKKTSAEREFRELIRTFPGTDEAKAAQTELRGSSK